MQPHTGELPFLKLSFPEQGVSELLEACLRHHLEDLPTPGSYTTVCPGWFLIGSNLTQHLRISNTPGVASCHHNPIFDDSRYDPLPIELPTPTNISS